MILLEKRSIESARNKVILKKNPASVEIQDRNAFVKWASEVDPNLLSFYEPEPNKNTSKKPLITGKKSCTHRLCAKKGLKLNEYLRENPENQIEDSGKKLKSQD